MKFIKATNSLCPVCLDKISANVVSENDDVYLMKECPSHGSFKVRHPWSSIKHYDAVHKLNIGPSDCAFAAGLVINLNSTCNQNCSFCFAVANEHSFKDPSFEEIKEKISNFNGSLIYLCGGEPTLRDDLFEIISLVKKCGYKVILFTNGKRLLDINYARFLKKAGLHMVILQFDTFNEERSKIIRGEKLVQDKLIVLENLREINIPVYLFTMLVKEINLDEIGSLLKYVVGNSNVIKIINFNPVWELGRLGYHEELNASDILKEIEKQTPLTFKDFLECSLFSYYLFELIRKITKKGGRRHPMCEMRCYIVSDEDSFVPLNRRLDLNRINGYLKEFHEVFFSGSNPKKQLKALSKAVFLFLSIISNGYVAKFIARCLWKVIFEKLHIYFKPDIISVIVGTFHTEETIDFDLVNTCNLFSASNYGNISSCLSQIYYLRSLTLPAD